MQREAAWRLAMLAAAVALALPAAATVPSAADAADACPLLQQLPGVGPVCVLENGLLEVMAPDGTSLGTISPPHPMPASVGDPRKPWNRALSCVDPAEDPYHVQLIYAIHATDADRPKGVADVLHMAERANRIVFDAAAKSGVRLDIETVCDADGTPLVPRERLPFSNSDASFSAIKSELMQRGYDDPRVKYWVLYDQACCGPYDGIGNIYGDDRHVADNLNNGAAGSPMYAVTFGLTGEGGAKIMLHELGHTMGAVQDSAPHSTGAGHCTDGLDVMCYNDGGPRGGAYWAYSCPLAQEVHSVALDCKRDDYFDANPLPGSYLATHWNVASPLNRYLERATLGADLATCAPREVPNAGPGCNLP